MLSAALIYGIIVTIVALTLGRSWIQAEHDCESMKEQRNRHREDFKEANDRKWELLEANNALNAKVERQRAGARALAEDLDQVNRDRQSLRGLLETVTAERDGAVRETAKWKEAAEYAVNNLREIDRILSEHMQAQPTADIPF